MKRAFYRYFIIGYGNHIPVLKFFATLPDDPLADCKRILTEYYRFISHIMIPVYMLSYKNLIEQQIFLV